MTETITKRNFFITKNFIVKISLNVLTFKLLNVVFRLQFDEIYIIKYILCKYKKLFPFGYVFYVEIVIKLDLFWLKSSLMIINGFG